MIKIFLITSLVVANLGLIPITILILRRMMFFGGIDLYIFAFGIIAWMPNVIMRGIR